jgi:hypothetical protein
MDVNGGQTYPNANGSPIGPGTHTTGPLLAGGVINSDGSGNLASLGGQVGTANVGYVAMAQTAIVSQTTTSGQSTGVFVTPIVIPAQSQIVRILLMVTTAWTTGTTTLGIGATAGTTAGTAFTTATGVAGGTAGQVSATPSTTAQIANWNNVSNSTFQTVPVDVRIIITSGGGVGAGVGTLTVEYIQGINNAS